MKKKIIAVLLSACMLVSACPTGAFAMSDEETNTYAATGDVVQGGTSVVDETSAPEATEAPEQTPTPAPEETSTPAPAETPAPVEVKAQATPAANAEEAAPAKQSEEAGISTAMLLPDDEKPAVDTYRFYDADGTELTEWQQTVAAGEELLEPTSPTKENARFVGWYDESGNLFEGFGTVASVSGKEVTVTAEFEEYSYVYFMNEDGTQVVYYTAAGVAGEKVAEADLNAATAKVELTMGKEKGVVGWSTTPGSDTPETITFVAGDTYVYPVVKTGFWVTFNTAGGDYVAPKFQMGTPLDLNTVTPTRSGYTFDGWYIDGQKVTSVSAEATVTAHWKANTKTEYTVIHWQENANDNEYSSKDIEKKTGATNSTTNAKAKSYPGFTAQTIEQKTIAGDGSTIVNIYYKRNVYMVKFYSNYGRKEYTDLRITAKYGANISDKWPTYNGSSTWYIGKNSNTSQVNIDTMPLNGAKFYGPMTGYGSETAYYYVEVLPGETGTTTIGGITYKEDHHDTSPGKGYNVTKEDQYPITGFTFNANVSTPIHGKYNNAKFYYTRDSYDIIFINGSDPKKTESRKYQQDISNVNYTPEKKPAGVPANFMFAGWYDNELCAGDPFVFTGKTMPAQSITLYAKWQAPVIEATVYLTASADGASETIEIPYGTKLSDSEAFKKLLDEEFTEEKPSAWIDSNGALFNVNTELYGSVTISPFFPSAKDGFTVTYIEGENENVDNQKYVSGSSARVLPPKNSDKFLAWETEEHTLIHPGDKITVTKNTTLRAVYTNKPQTETITYHYNFGDSTDKYTDDNGGKGYPKNTTATVKSLGEVKFTAPTGYKFLGWATKPDSNTVTYKVGATVFIDAKGNNNLYAVWQEETYKVTYELKDVGKSDWETVQTAKVNAVTGNKTTQPSKTYETKYVDGVKYEFDGWYTNAELTGSAVEFPYTVTSDVTFYAAYKEAEKYELKYDLAEGSWAASETDKELEYKQYAGDKITVKSDPVREGYKFAGWTSKEITVSSKFTMPAKNVTLTAQWEEIQYEVKYKLKDAGKDDWQTVQTAKVNAVTGNKTTQPSDTYETKYVGKVKYEFDGWYLDESLETPVAFPYTVTSDVTFYAAYKEAEKYELKYDLAKGSWAASETDTKLVYKQYAGDEITVKSDPVREGYTFTGWTSKEITVSSKFTMPAKDVTLKAKWEANIYKVTYDLDGGEWTEATNEFPYEYKATVEVVKTVPTREGYTFAGWRSEEVTIENDAFTMPAKDVTLKAKWEANIYKVTYDLDGGEWTEATNEFPYEYKATVEVIKTVPTREGYKFSGWRSEEVTIENGAFTMPAKDVVLKAVWEANPTPTPIPSEEPTPTPTPTPTPAPSEQPTEKPTPTPTPAPTAEPTSEPTATPTATPSAEPTAEPTTEPTATPAPNPNPATPTPAPVTPVVPATVATPTPTPTATPSAAPTATPSDNGGKGDGNNDGEIGETINDNETPLTNGEDIADNATPLAGLGTGAWALINLILTIVTTLLSILLLIGYIGKKKKALEDEDGNVVLDENGKEVMEYEKNKKGLWRLISIIPALIAIIVFIFTEDMTLPMIFVDKWTILHVVIALVQVVVMVLCKKKKDENDEDENAANA